MGYNKENYRRIRKEYEDKFRRAEADADARREELYREIPELRELDGRLSALGLRVMEAAMKREDTERALAEMRSENEKNQKLRAGILRAHGFPEDYSTPHYECDKCKDTGFVGITMCECMRLRLVEAGMESSGLGGLLGTQSFENYSLDYYRDDPEAFRRMSHYYSRIRAYAEEFTVGGEHPSGSMLFLGGTGLGKTHLSTAVAKTVIGRGYDVFYNSAVGMISDYEYRRFGNGTAMNTGEDTERYLECDLLIIDDLGTEVVNQFTLSCLYYVLNTRLNAKKPTLISTNLTSAELRKNYTDRIISRMLGEFDIYQFCGNDVRMQKIRK